jgi:hypothetical protein
LPCLPIFLAWAVPVTGVGNRHKQARQVRVFQGMSNETTELNQDRGEPWIYALSWNNLQYGFYVTSRNLTGKGVHYSVGNAPSQQTLEVLCKALPNAVVCQESGIRKAAWDTASTPLTVPSLGQNLAEMMCGIAQLCFQYAQNSKMVRWENNSCLLDNRIGDSYSDSWSVLLQSLNQLIFLTALRLLIPSPHPHPNLYGISLLHERAEQNLRSRVLLFSYHSQTPWKLINIFSMILKRNTNSSLWRSFRHHEFRLDREELKS